MKPGRARLRRAQISPRNPGHPETETWKSEDLRTPSAPRKQIFGRTRIPRLDQGSTESRPTRLTGSCGRRTPRIEVPPKNKGPDLHPAPYTKQQEPSPRPTQLRSANHPQPQPDAAPQINADHPTQRSSYCNFASSTRDEDSGQRTGGQSPELGTRLSG